VEYPVIEAQYSGPGEEPVLISYQVHKGTLRFPLAPLTTSVLVDLSYVGPPNPNDPDPVNPDLLKVHLEGVDGIEDELNPNDYGNDVTATVPLYAPVSPGEILSLYWGTQDTPVDTFTVVGEKPDDPIDFIIPWAAIEAQANNAALPMYYTINGPAGNNPQHSESTPVVVNVLTVHFDPVSFPDIYDDGAGNRTLSCLSLYSEDYDNPAAKFGFRVQVPGSPNLKAGDSIISQWLGYEFDGSTEITPTRFTHTKTGLTEDEAKNGFIFLVEPYATHILPISQGYAEVTYIVRSGGAPDTPADPMPEKQFVSLLRPGLITCEVPPPKPTP
jgi:hypothetical protein